MAAALVGAMGGTGLGIMTAMTEPSDAHVPVMTFASASTFDLGIIKRGVAMLADNYIVEPSIETNASTPPIRTASLDAGSLLDSSPSLTGLGATEKLALLRAPASGNADGFDRAFVMEDDLKGFHHDLFATTLASLDPDRFSGALAEHTVIADEAIYARLSVEELSGEEVALLAPLPEAPRAVASVAPVEVTPSEPQRSSGGTELAYAAPEDPVEESKGGVMDGFKKLFNRSMGLPGPGSGIAVYDIRNAVVYMPNGQRLEAHSGLGHMKDNPRYTHVKMKGATPPNIYNLRMREALFHGVEAIRMLPTDEPAMRGRDGILAHTAMLRGTNGSNGCLSFKHYDKFLTAFKRGEVDKIIVVPDMSHLPTYMASL